MVHIAIHDEYIKIMIRKEILRLNELGPLPDESDDGSYPDEFFEEFEDLLNRIVPPLSTSEAIILIQLFPPVSCFGIGYSLLHLIESIPKWPVNDILMKCNSEEWKSRLIRNAKNKDNL